MKKRTENPLEALTDAFKTPDNFEVIGNTVNGTCLHPIHCEFWWRLAHKP